MLHKKKTLRFAQNDKCFGVILSGAKDLFHILFENRFEPDRAVAADIDLRLEERLHFGLAR